MKKIRIFFPILLIVFTGCRTTSDFNQVLEDMQENLDFGNLSAVIQIADSLKKFSSENKEILHIADSLEQIAGRTGIDFSVSEKEVRQRIEKLNGPFSDQEKDAWEKKGWLEFRMIDGEKKYFKRAASNLILIKKFREHKEERLREIANEPDIVFRLKHTEGAFKASNNQSNPVAPVNMIGFSAVLFLRQLLPENQPPTWGLLHHASGIYHEYGQAPL